VSGKHEDAAGVQSRVRARLESIESSKRDLTPWEALRCPLNGARRHCHHREAYKGSAKQPRRPTRCILTMLRTPPDVWVTPVGNRMVSLNGWFRSSHGPNVVPRMSSTSIDLLDLRVGSTTLEVRTSYN
jgi:hypothetical protein